MFVPKRTGNDSAETNYTCLDFSFIHMSSFKYIPAVTFPVMNISPSNTSVRVMSACGVSLAFTWLCLFSVVQQRIGISSRQVINYEREDLSGVLL